MVGIAHNGASTSEPFTRRMLSHLRRQFRVSGLRFADVAELLGVSERSVKRYMGGKGVTLDVLEKLCAAAGVTVLELAELAAADHVEQPAFTDAVQEDALADDVPMSICYYLLAQGWTPARIASEFSLAESEMDQLLIRMDRLGLISLYPGNRVKIRVVVRSADDCSRRLRESMVQGATYLMATADFNSSDTIWRGNIARLGPASFARISQRFQSFIDEVVELSKQDMDLDGKQVKWYGVWALMRPQPGIRLRPLKRRKSGQ